MSEETPVITIDELTDLSGLVERYARPAANGQMALEVRLVLYVDTSKPFDDVELDPEAEEILQHMRQINRDTRRPVPTVALAARLYCHRATAYKRLKRLEKAGIIRRPSPKGGWQIAT